MHEAKTHLSRLVERVEGGEEIIIGRAGKPVAKLVPYQENGRTAAARRLEGSGLDRRRLRRRSSSRRSSRPSTSDLTCEAAARHPRRCSGGWTMTVG